MHKRVCSNVFCVGPTADMLPITNHGHLPAPLLFWGLQYLVEKQTSAGKEDDFQYLGWRISPCNLSPFFKTNRPLLQSVNFPRRRNLTYAVCNKWSSVDGWFWTVFIMLNIVHYDMSVLVNAHITFVLVLNFVFNWIVFWVYTLMHMSQLLYIMPPICFLSCCRIEYVSVLSF